MNQETNYKNDIYAGKAQYRRGWEIVNWAKVPKEIMDTGIELDEKYIIRLCDEEVITLLEAVAKTELINKVLADRVYDKDIANRHLNIIESLIVKIK